MKLIRLFLLTLMIYLTINANAEDTNANLDFELPGKTSSVKLSDFKGKVVYLDFWASWCGPCKQSFPWMNAMQEKYRSQGLEIVGVNLDMNSDDAQKFLATTPAKFTIAFDNKGQTPKIYGVKAMPSSYVLSRDGKIIYQHMGFNDHEKDKLEQKLTGNLGAKEILKG